MVLYALMTWLHEKFDAVPYLRFRGIAGSGKTRASNVVGRISYRGLAMSGATSPATMFRLIDAVGPTLILDEADYEKSQIGSDAISGSQSKYLVMKERIEVASSSTDP